MPTTTTVRFRPALPIDDVPSSARGLIVLLHVDATDTPAAHALLLVHPLSDADTGAITVGRPLPECPEFAVARIWHDATSLDAARLSRHADTIPRLCPLCTRSPD